MERGTNLSTNCVARSLPIKSLPMENALPIRSTAGGARPSRADDEVLIRAAQSGDAAAFEELVRHYERPVLRLAMHLTGSVEDAQDIYQEAFLRAYLNLSAFRFECSFFTWLYRIVANLCLDHLRKRNSRGRDVATITLHDGESHSIVDYVVDERSGASPERSVLGGELRGH